MAHRILFIASHRPGRSPSQRFRFEQYRDWLAERGFESEQSWLVSASDDARIYAPGHLGAKIGFAIRSQFTRARDLARADDFDLVFVHREALMTRGRWFERALSRMTAKVIFDFDDAIWMHGESAVSAANRAFAWVKDPDRTAESIALADLVFAGNGFLADYARARNPAVRVVPTTIDTDRFRTRRDRDADADGPVCIGWSGSPTTTPHLATVEDALVRVKERFGDRVRFRMIGDASWSSDRLGVRGEPWTLESELAGVDDLDIGIMPLPDDEWVKGKCGFKALLYMSLEIPAVVTPVGVNPEIVQDGENGLHAGTTDDWVEALSRLVEDAELRRRLGRAGRRTVETRYSVSAWRDVYLESFRGLLAPEASPR